MIKIHAEFSIVKSHFIDFQYPDACLFLTEHSLTDCSDLYRIPLDLLKNREQHNEIIFFRACFWSFQNSLNYKIRLLAAVNVCHYKFSLIFHPGHYKSFFDYFSGRGLAVPLAFQQKISLKNMHEKNYFV